MLTARPPPHLRGAPLALGGAAATAPYTETKNNHCAAGARASVVVRTALRSGGVVVKELVDVCTGASSP